ncbi:MAG TPA: hypothetical protein PLR99_31835, partial [Polyangiaceae bacterium]|nr:hypothetical protein [Polyangiaceae bacterium]
VGPVEDLPVSPLPGANGPLTFGSFNYLAKLSDTTLRLWARVLAAVPGSRLLLKGSYAVDEPTRGDKRSAADGTSGASSAASRLSGAASVAGAGRGAGPALDEPPAEGLAGSLEVGAVPAPPPLVGSSAPEHPAAIATAPSARRLHRVGTRGD